MSELIVGIDTSTRVAIGLADDDRVLASLLVGDTRSHVELLAPTIARLLADTGRTPGDVTGIGVGIGPGPFTGLRVGIATAQTLGEALGVPVKGVCSLDVIGLANAGARGEFVAALDARRHEVYWARYDATGLRTEGPFVTAPADVPRLPVVGPACATYPELGDDAALDAGFLAANLERLPLMGLEPLYLRQPDAELPSTRKSTIAGGRLRLPLDVR